MTSPLVFDLPEGYTYMPKGKKFPPLRLVVLLDTCSPVAEIRVLRIVGPPGVSLFCPILRLETRSLTEAYEARWPFRQITAHTRT